MRVYKRIAMKYLTQHVLCCITMLMTVLAVKGDVVSNQTIVACRNSSTDPVTSKPCCQGYWGSMCQECPGGPSSPCTGHGSCDDGVNGTGNCTCDVGWSGYSCEFCNKTTDVYPNCTTVSEGDMCKNTTCSAHSQCIVMDNEPVCMCDWPHVDHNTDYNDTHTQCQEIDVCKLPPLCDTYANCTPIETNTGYKDGVFKSCDCNVGYHGDGYVCNVSNRCQDNYGGCDVNTTQCVYIEPGKSRCDCLAGYQEYVEGHGCSLIDLCLTNKSECHHKASCKTVRPYQLQCTCPQDYVGDGKLCYANLLQTIGDLNEYDSDIAVNGQLTLIQTALSKYYKREITEHGPFTMFIPVNDGFRKIPTDFQKWLNDKIRTRQILRNHMLVGEFTIDELTNTTHFYTLQGQSAQIVADSYYDVIRYRLMGTNRKARLIKGDIPASNGVVHIISKLISYEPDSIGNEEVTIQDQIKANGHFTRMEKMVEVAGEEIQSLLSAGNMTVFVPTNTAWDSLHAGSFQHLTETSEGKVKLISILKHHIYNGSAEIADLINMNRFTSMTMMSVELTVTYMGQVQLNTANITQADIATSNGIIHEIDKVLIPSGVSTLPNRCDEFTYKLVKGPCGDCREASRCFEPDVPTNLTETCQYFAMNMDGKYVKNSGCALLCNRTYTVRKCCDGFYGYDCLPCPGGYLTPCHGRGTCAETDGDRETVCECEENYSGEACDQCSLPDKFGPDCTQDCTCIHGVCQSGPTGNGLCQPRCDYGYFGSNCHKTNFDCDWKYCHTYAQCILVEETISDYRCMCKAGYIGDGENNCEEMDPCVLAHYGGCHLQATCTKTGPGERNCSCNQGFVGDGVHCYPATSCSLHGDCDENADCIETSLNKHICRCRDGYHGNGQSCDITRRCLENNGGCHPKATCTQLQPGVANCTCNLDNGYSGDGFSCYGNLVTMISDHQNLTKIAYLLKMASTSELELLLDRNYTIFVPTDTAITQFITRLGIRSKQFETRDSMLTILNYHTLLGAINLDNLVAMSQFKKLETIEDGFFIYITRDTNNDVHLMPRKGGETAQVLEADIVAVNGYLNVIDTVLEPYEPMSPDDYPDLDTFFIQHPEYSVFGQWLKKKNLTEKIESLNAYTLFVPNNDAMAKINRTVTTDYLRYYLIPKMVMMASVDNYFMLTSDLGVSHSLQVNVWAYNNLTVNNVTIEKVDMFTFGGLVNGISGLLHPIVHVCNENITHTDFGPCSKCSATYSCDTMSKPLYYGLTHAVTCHYSYKESSTRYQYITELGCKGLCYRQKEVMGCCAGYYGADCEECPSGPEISCSGHGTCNDGLKGTGSCTCEDKFEGDSCNTCIEGWTGHNCDIDMSGCGFQNGGCHGDAVCSLGNNGSIVCKCGPGYRGDGYNCTGPCQVNNGGCHQQADCTYKVSDGVSCSCPQGYVGDGKVTCNQDILTTLATRTDTSIFLKNIGNTDPELSVMLHNISEGKMYTVFVPIDKGLQGRFMSRDQISQQIVISNTSIQLTSVDFIQQNVTNIRGENINIMFDSKQNMFSVNNTAVIVGNLPCTNGIIHLVAAPFSSSLLLRQHTGTQLTIGHIVGIVVAVVVIATIIVVMVTIYYKRKNSGYWTLLQNWRSNRRSSESSSQVEPLHFNEPHDTSSGLPDKGNTNFGNPLYKAEELE